MIPVLDARAARGADAAAIRAGTPSDALMENAAAALAEALVRARPDWRRVVVVCGPGNNGGDGLAGARLLAARGVAVRLFTLGDPARYRGDAAANLSRAAAVGIAPVSLAARGGPAEFARELRDADGAVDALFGTGLTRPLSGIARRAVRALNASGRPVVSADVPSGLSSDGGEVSGDAVRAALTVAFAAPKPCHVLPPASGFCGRVLVADIGIRRWTLEARARRFWLAEASDVRALLPPRPREAHKATFGRLAIVAGSRGKTGAAILAARGALRGGAGLVTVLCAESLEGLVVDALPEAMTIGLPEERGALSERAIPALLEALTGFDAAVVGPGLGTAPGTVRLLEAVVSRARLPLLVDADGLNAFAGRPAFLRRPRTATVLTPHPGEAARLLATSAARVQADRLGAARSLARRSGSVALLKGAHTLVAAPTGEVAVNPTGTPLLATAGSGDVLSGLIGALLAGGLAPRAAAVAGAWLHGAAAEALAPRLGDAGLLAHEIADAVPGVRAALRAGSRRHA
ncbi:MAG TPA: NAD(P)H-hydrate dehydratase [Thermoanaerobaculia bacterium]|nr:NAD(P)H-hydrate dehydratase [Thermoanaerobaculia bacterium]